MRSKVKFSLVELSENELEKHAVEQTQWIFTQDMIHIGTKIRNRLLKPDIIMPLGDSFISISHLKTLVKNVSKDVHHLVLSDICPSDRQNYASLEKIMSDRVIEALEKNVVDSKGTIMFLRVCKEITSSYLDENMKPVKRIYNIWHALYFFRAWRKFITSPQNTYRLAENFITSNAYQCIEINAHSLIYAILKLRNINKAQLFRTSLFSSQPCERTFRQMRSLGTPNFTKVNFTLYELLHMVSRIELMNEIKSSNILANDGSSDGVILFPEKENQTKAFDLPNNIEILTAIKSAKKDALEDARKFGIIVQPADIALCELKPANIDNDDVDDDSEGDFSDCDGSDQDNEVDEEDDDNHTSNYSSTDENSGLDSNKHSKFVQVETEDGKLKEIRKSRLIWILTEDKKKLSSDRMYRVKTTEQCLDKHKRKRRRSD